MAGGLVLRADSSDVPTVRCEGDPAGTYGFVDNTGADAGGFAFYASSGDFGFEAVACDLGSLLDGTENSVPALHHDPADWVVSVGTDVDMSCDASGCGAQDTTLLGTTDVMLDLNDRIFGWVFEATDHGTLDSFSMRMQVNGVCLLDYYVLSTPSQSSRWSLSGLSSTRCCP